MSSVHFLMQTTINGDTHLEGIFFESLLFVENKGVDKQQELNECACGALSSLEPSGVAVFERKHGDLCELMLHLVLIPLSACPRGLSFNILSLPFSSCSLI